MSFHIEMRACGWVGARIFEFCGGVLLFFLSKQMSEREKGKGRDRECNCQLFVFDKTLLYFPQIFLQTDCTSHDLNHDLNSYL